MGDIMKQTQKITVEDLDYMIEKKVLEILGDPDLGLELTDDFREKLKKRLASRQEKISQKEVMKRFG